MFDHILFSYNNSSLLKTMRNFPEKTVEEWNLIGKSICDGKDWRWVAIWSYNIHKLFRPKFASIKIWEELDSLIDNELEWHQGKNLFESIRNVSFQTDCNKLDGLYLSLGEIVAKSLSNASWYPGLFDYHVPWKVPGIAMEIAQLIDDTKLIDYLNNHFFSLSQNRVSDKPYRKK
jgi:hypothetical protein